MRFQVRALFVNAPLQWTLSIGVAVILSVMFCSPPVVLSQDDELSPVASWKMSSEFRILGEFSAWLDETDVEESVKIVTLNKLGDSLSQDGVSEPLAAIVEGMGSLRPEVAELVRRLGSNRPRAQIEAAAMLNRMPAEMFVVDHLRLYLAKWLVQNELYDEALEQFEKLSLSRVLDPAALLFYKAIALQQLVRTDDCLEATAQLLENAEEVPRRYSIVSKLILADLKPMAPNSLDEISRLMNDIRRRQSLSRAGTRVRTEEEKVLAKLDAMIKEKEKQQQQMQKQQSKSSQSKSSPKKAMQDSQNAPLQGTGDVLGKKKIEGGDWGNLPPQKRAAALAEMAKDLPPHYRSVIEEYFRKLAQDDDQ